MIEKCDPVMELRDPCNLWDLQDPWDTKDPQYLRIA